MAMGKLNQTIIILMIFFTVLFIYCSRTIFPLADSRWTIHIANSLIQEGNVDLDEYQDILKKHGFYAIEKHKGHFYSMFPVGVSFLAVPVVCVLDKLSQILMVNYGDDGLNKHSLNNMIIQKSIPVGLELFIASFYLALAAVFWYLIARRNLKTSQALIIVFIFAFCTAAWSTASRALWQHGPSLVMLTIALYLMLLSEEKADIIQYVGLPLAFSYVIRPTNSLSVVLLTCFVFFQYRKYFIRYLIWAAVIAFPFILLNYSIYGSLLPPYYQPERLFTNLVFLEALMGNLFSPGRGLFVFSPIFILSLLGIFIKIREKRFLPRDYYLLMIIVLHWVVISTFRHWWGGHCYGYRLFSDMIPYFIYFLIPVVEKIFVVLKNTRKKIAIALFAFLICISFYMHFWGSVHGLSQYYWNTTPNNIDEHPERLWDWSDPPFLRGIIKK